MARRLRIYRQSYTLILIATLTLLLVILAVLQYRWLGKTSESERDKMQKSLLARSNDFRGSFNREIQHAYSAFHIAPNKADQEDWSDFIERSNRWYATALFPDLVKNVYLAGQNGAYLTLSRFNKKNNQFEPCEWPAELAGVRSQFEGQELTIDRSIFRRLIDDRVPALMQIGDSQVHRWVTIITLDLDYIRQTLMPTLVDSYFLDNNALDYDIAVVNPNDPDNMIYKSNPSSPNWSLSGDVVVDIFSLVSAPTTGPKSGQTIIPNGDDDKSSPPDGTLLLIAPNHEARQNPAQNSLLDVNAVWKLLIRHRAGSLDAAVARMRWQNLAISFGILFLLGISVIMVILNARRTQRLAVRQMEFVAGVSHEFRTPLAVIHAIGENLADGVVTDKQQIEQCGAVIRDDVRRLSGMVEQVLEFGGVSKVKNLYHPCPVNITALIDEALSVTALNASSPGKEWTVEKELEQNLPDVLADSAALASALRNIIDNSIKYSDAVRRLHVKAATIPNGRTKMVRVTIEDSGRGISPADLPHIFAPFYRGKDVVADQIHGSGLGLSLVKNIIEAQGGSIGIESTIGKGTIFTLQLPVAE